MMIHQEDYWLSKLPSHLLPIFFSPYFRTVRILRPHINKITELFLPIALCYTVNLTPRSRYFCHFSWIMITHYFTPLRLGSPAQITAIHLILTQWYIQGQCGYAFLFFLELSLT